MHDILVAVDLGPSTAPTLAAARQLAARPGTRLHVLHVAPPDPDFVGYEPGPPSVRIGIADELRDEHRAVGELVDSLRAGGVEADGRLLRGATIDAILAEAARIDADLIVVGRHARSALFETLIGSTSTALLHRARRPVLVVPPGSR